MKTAWNASVVTIVVMIAVTWANAARNHDAAFKLRAHMQLAVFGVALLAFVVLSVILYLRLPSNEKEGSKFEQKLRGARDSGAIPYNAAVVLLSALTAGSAGLVRYLSDIIK